MKDTEITKVVFRKFKEGDIIALFPEILGTYDPRTCMSYQHIGQHGSADTAIINDTYPARVNESDDLFQELTAIGYNLKEYKKVTRKMTETRLNKYKTLRGN